MSATMIPFRFGPPGEQLYGAFHKPDARRPPAAAVLLCNPFGQEAVRVHRLYRVLADRLADAGHAVLRFDLQGTGDADGDDETPGLGAWTRDVLRAHDELTARAGHGSAVWIGARLGAWLAARASARLAQPLQALVLWDPVTDGAAYLRELAQAHAAAQQHALRPPVPARDEPAGEAIGFALSGGFKADLARIRAADYGVARAGRVLCLTQHQRPLPALARAAWRQALPGWQETALEMQFDWTSEEALNTALVPHEAVRRLVSLVEGNTP